MDSKNRVLNIDASDSVANDAVRQALRSFSGSIAHDFNNLLTMLMAYPQLIRRDVREGSQGHELLDIMEQNAELMAGIASRLSNFALPTGSSKNPIDLDDAVREVLSDFDDYDFTSDIKIVTDLNSECNVTVPHNALWRMIKEVCLNAFESMADRGVLTVATDDFMVDEPIFCLKSVVPVGRYARIRVSDTGNGISDTDFQKVIEPFFTINKKNSARGSGLGLTIVFSVICDCGGYLILENGDNGFTVTILLPPVADACEDIAESIANENVGESGSGSDFDRPRVLVVDDEEEIVNLFKLMLGSAIENIDVDIAHNGCEALNAFKGRHHDVIIMDLHMPVMDGHEAFKKLTELCAVEGLRMPAVIFCTGYIPPEGIRQAVSTDAHHSLLQKPVTIKSLIDAVKERLPA